MSLVSLQAVNGRAARIAAPNRNKGASKASHYSDEWYTPRWVVEPLGAFDLDPCAGPNAYAARNLSVKDDGLSAQWEGRVWLNPPYSNIHEWLERMIAHGNGIALVNARTDTQWFQHTVRTATGLLWLKGRVKFERPDAVATNMPVGSVLIGWGDDNARVLQTCGLPGFFTPVLTPKTDPMKNTPKTEMSPPFRSPDTRQGALSDPERI